MRARECEEDGGVAFRNLESEWIPARHKPNLRTPNPRTDRGTFAVRNNWIDVWKPERGCVTFFFTNFPAECDSKVLYGKFREIGVVRDLFIPKKLDKKGKKYGFIRFCGDVITSLVEQKLNKIWIRSYKLRANISKFVRRTVKDSRRDTGEEGLATINRVISRDALRRGEINRTYRRLGQTLGRETLAGRNMRPKTNLQDLFTSLQRRTDCFSTDASPDNLRRITLGWSLRKKSKSPGMEGFRSNTEEAA
ncbi:hypothetical protein ACS0TY_024174 [Phlomoides rotata]